MDSLDKVGDARSLAQVVVEAVREPLLVLDENFTILAASDSFHKSFKTFPSETFHHDFFTLSGGVWNIPELRELLGRALVEPEVLDFDLSLEFPKLGWRDILLNVRLARSDDRLGTTLLLGFEDVTAKRVMQREKDLLQMKTDDLLKKEHTLLEEMQHRIVNSLQIIASILMLKARTVKSEETRDHLKDAHRRVLSVAEVQRYLYSAPALEKISLAPYLTKLCSSLGASMIGEGSNTELRVACSDGEVASADAVSAGLIVTELVINAVKYAFPDKTRPGVITVNYERNDTSWRLAVSDNGVGKSEGTAKGSKGGLGTSLVAALSNQLGASVSTTTGSEGVTVSIVHRGP